MNKPKLPPGPPNRSFKSTLFRGLIETKESKQRLRDYHVFMKGWRAALGMGPNQFRQFRPHGTEYP